MSTDSSDDGDEEDSPYLGTRATNPRTNARTRTNSTIGGTSVMRGEPESRVDLGMWGKSGDQPTVWEAVHYPNESEFQFDSFYLRYIRQAEAQAVIDKPVNDTWQDTPTIHDEAHADTDEPKSQFEEKVEELFEGSHTRRKPIHRLRTLDKLARLGEYAVMVIGFADGRSLETPVGGIGQDGLSEQDKAKYEPQTGVNVPEAPQKEEFSGLDDLMYLAVFGQDRVIDIETNSDMTSPRFRLPETFDIITEQSDDDAEDVGEHDADTVHWSRVIHVPEGTLEDDLMGVPALKPVFHELLNIDKIKAASGEGFWRAGYQGLHVRPPTDRNGQPMEFDDPDAVHQEIEEFLNNFDREVATPAEINSIESSVGNPIPHLEANYQSIAAATDIPKAVLTGEDRADTANSQDIRQWHQKIGQRRNSYAEPVILKPFIQRLIDSGVLPEPEGEGFVIEWPPLDEMSEQQEWEMRSTIATAIQTIAPGGNTGQFGTVPELRQAIGWDPNMGDEVDPKQMDPEVETTEEDLEADEEALPDTAREEMEYPDELYQTPAEAESRAVELGMAEDYHVVETSDGVFYRPGPNEDAFLTAMDEQSEQTDMADTETLYTLADTRTNLETSQHAKYDAGEKVVLDDGTRGVILELHVEPFKLDNEKFEASEDQPLYVVATEDKTLITDEGELEQKDWSVETEADPDKLDESHTTNAYQDVADPMSANAFSHVRTNVVDQRVITNEVVGEVDASSGIGFDSWPPTWEKSDTPARLIALDAWQSMGGDWDGCMRELNSAELCAAFKDEIYGTTQWRG